MSDFYSKALNIIKKTKEEKLTWLDLSYCKLSKIPPEILKIKDIWSLYLNGNNLTSFPKEILDFRHLELLDLGSNQINSIPEELSKLENLRILNLNNNNLTNLPSQFLDIRYLRELNLGDNRLTVIPKEITYLKNLELLNLGNNRITLIPKEIAKLKTLRYLYLNHNQITFLPEEISHLNQLSDLRIYGNHIRNIPPEIYSKINCLKAIIQYFAGISYHKNGVLVIYVPGDYLDALFLDDLIFAAGEFMETMGFISEYKEDPVYASFFQKTFFKFKNPNAAKDIDDVFGIAKKALNKEPIEGTHTDKTIKLVEAATNLIEVTSQADEVILQLAGLVYVKTTRNGKTLIFAETISPEQSSELEKNPDLFKKVDALLNFLRDANK